MSLTMRDPGGKDFETCPAGTHVARCYRVIDVGTHYSERFDKHDTQVMLSWELPEELMEDGRPFSVHSTYTASLHEKAKLRHHLEMWRGRAFTAEELTGFDLIAVLGAPCLVTIVHNEKGDKTYANVAGVTSMPKGSQCPPAINPPISFDIQTPDREVFDSLSESLRKKIESAPEWIKQDDTEYPALKADTDTAEYAEVVEDEVPF